MTTTTSRGYVLPEDSDPLANLAQTVRNLGQKVNDHLGLLACGSAVVAMGGTANATVAVTFPAGRFSSTPKVTTGVRHGNYEAFVDSPTSTGFTMRVKHRTDAVSSVNVDVDWIAVQQ